MNTPHPALPSRPLPLKPKWIAAGLLLLVVYLLLRPWLVERFGLDLPGFTDVKPQAEATSPNTSTTQARERREKNQPVDVPVIPEPSEPVIDDEVVSSDTKSVGAPNSAQAEKGTRPPDPQRTPAATKSPTPEVATTEPVIEKPKVTPSKPNPPVNKPAPPVAKTPTPQPKPGTTSKTKPATEASPPTLGVLKQVGRDRFESTAGLLYNQYRIDHVMDHARDNLDKPSHGVFEVETQAEVLALIDEAYQLAQKRGPPQVVVEDQGDRATYTVNMNRKIGHPGGQNGARNRNRPLNKVKLVLEGQEVVTAYPTN